MSKGGAGTILRSKEGKVMGRFSGWDAPGLNFKEVEWKAERFGGILFEENHVSQANRWDSGMWTEST